MKGESTPWLAPPLLLNTASVPHSFGKRQGKINNRGEGCDSHDDIIIFRAFRNELRGWGLLTSRFQTQLQQASGLEEPPLTRDGQEGGSEPGQAGLTLGWWLNPACPGSSFPLSSWHCSIGPFS